MTGRALITLACAAALVLFGCGESTSDRPTTDVLADLRVGMSAEEVEDALGEPETRSESPQALPAGVTSMELWGYDTTDAKVAVVFQDGAVTDFRGTDRIVTIPGG